MSRYLSHLAALTLKQLVSVQPRLASRFETPVDRGASAHNGLDAAQETRVSMPYGPERPSTVNAPDSPDHMKLMQSRMVSQFESPLSREPSTDNRLDAARETQVTKPIVPTLITVSTESQANKASNGQDHPKLVQPSEFKFNPSEPLGEQQKTSSNKNFSLVDQTLDKLVEQALQAAHKGIRATENERTLVERVQEHFTETTHNEHQTIIKTEASTPPGPVKPLSIKPWPEQYTFGSNTPGQSSAQILTAGQFNTEAIPAPAIQVTIGRIEIRATQVADKPVAKPSATSNTMSLDDYLKQRNGGKS